MTELGDRIRARRLAAGLSQRKLADLVEVGFPHLSKIENGTETPSDDLLAKLARALDDDIDELMAAARRVPPDLVATVVENENARVFLRMVQSGDITAKELQDVVKRRKRG